MPNDIASIAPHQPVPSSPEDRPIPPPRLTATVTLRVPGLVKGMQDNALDQPTQRVVLPDDLGAAGVGRTAHPAVAAWNQKHVFLRHAAGGICIPIQRDAGAPPSRITDGSIQLSLPQPGIAHAADPSHCLSALQTHAEFRLSVDHRLLGYCVNGNFVASVLPHRGVYPLAQESHAAGKWMCHAAAPGQTFSAYAVMMLLEGKPRAEAAATAGALVEQAESRIADDKNLLDFLAREGGSWKPFSANLHGKSRAEAIQHISELLARHERPVLLVTGSRMRLIDGIGISPQGVLTVAFRDAYTGAQRVVPDHEDFWVTTERLPQIFDAPGHVAPSDAADGPHRNGLSRGVGDYVVYMVPATAPAPRPKPGSNLPV